jgi:asparaginyl-tRNA synthetase
MKWTVVSEVCRHAGETVELRGWIANRRSSKKIRFLQVRDGSGIIQCTVLKDHVSSDVFELTDTIPYESSVVVRGEVIEDSRSPGGFELRVDDVEVVSEAQPYPITKKEHGVSFLMDHRHLWLRSSKQTALMEIRSKISRAARGFFDDLGFVSVEAPVLTPTACEGTTSLFEVGYFDRSAYLTQSGQLYG